MFKLHKLEISGFKSFADYTEVVFTGAGITAVVGPNGCGKSNISDAITWVLGEQKAKNLRGGEMQDVIFAGAKSRQPSGMAEVVLHLVRVETGENEETGEIDDIDEVLTDFDDNFQTPDFDFQNGDGFHETEIAVAETTDNSGKTATRRKWKSRRAALEFAPGESVSITRRLYRSGDSDYLLNGRACRLRDIQDLFAGTGLSGGHYALIQQEKISQILSAKPADRRNLIEEAAGITKFRTRQRAAEIRLDGAKTNLRRISDIVSEIDKQASSLRRQAARTRRYKELQTIFRELLAQVFTAENAELNSALEDLREKLITAVSAEKSLTEQVESQTIAAHEATQKSRLAEENLTEIRQDTAENALRRERQARDLIHQNEQKNDLEKRLAEFKFEIKNLTEKLASVVADAERLREKNQNSQSSNEIDEEKLKAVEQTYQQKISAVREIETKIEKIRQELFQAATAAERFREIIKQQSNALERLTTRAATLDKEGARAAQTHHEKQNESSAVEQNKINAANNLRILRDEKQKSSEKLKTARGVLNASDNELAGLREKLNGVKNRRDALAKIDAQNAHFAPVVGKLLASADKIGVKINGTLADFLRVEPQFEKAVETVLSQHLQTILIDDETTVAKIYEWTKINNAGKINLLIQNSKPNHKKRVAGENRIADLINVSGELNQILNAVLPFEMNFRVIENMRESADFLLENCVTQNGEIIRQNSLFSFGASNTNEKGGILSFKRELRELSSQATTLEGEFAAAEISVKNEREKIAALEKSFAEINAEIAVAERAAMTLDVNLKSLQQEIERAARHQKVVAEEQNNLQTERAEIANKIEKLEADAENAEAGRVNAENKLAEITKQLTIEKNAAETANADLSEQRAAAAAARERRRSLQNAVRRVETEHAEIKNRLEIRQKDHANAAAKFAELAKNVAALNQQNADFDDEKETEETEIADALRDLQTARAVADTRAAELGKINAQAAAAKDERAALEVGQAELSIKLENLHETCRHELNQPLQNLLSNEFVEPFDLIENKRKADDLREKIENFGAVNLLALEELNETEERFLFLTGQRKDIIDSIAAAEDALGEIKRRSRERFEFAFRAINQNFKELFSDIFGGGRGEMNLLEAADVLEAGIEIVAQPPGKRLQNLLLLSGGEKAMAAIALVLAIFRFRPAPFCLLDEVDAPLDEANVGRFVEKVEQMSVNTQFIVITHNKRTMEAAKALYGVTMQEAGISQIVSVKFE